MEGLLFILGLEFGIIYACVIVYLFIKYNDRRKKSNMIKEQTSPLDLKPNIVVKEIQIQEITERPQPIEVIKEKQEVIFDMPEIKEKEPIKETGSLWDVFKDIPR